MGKVLSLGMTRTSSSFFTIRSPDGTEQKMRPGGTFELKAGGELRLNTLPLSAQATIGYHFDSTQASNGSITFSRAPLEVLAYWNPTPKHKLGGGIRYVTMASVKGSGITEALGANDFDNAIGTVFEAEYLVNAKMGVSVRYVQETYKLNGASYKINGNHYGARMNVYF